MLSMRVAVFGELNQLLKLLNQASDAEKALLLYRPQDTLFIDRLYKNITDGHVTVFLVDQTIVGFIEYTVHPKAGVWIFTLFVEEASRKYTSRFVPVAFNAIKKLIKKDINFAVDKQNKPMNTLAKYIKAVPIREYGDGRVEWRVKVNVRNKSAN